MVTTVRQTVTVTHDGRLEIVAPELHAGETAEVTILVPDAAAKLSSPDRVAALDALRKAARLTPKAAEEWIAQIRSEREAGHDRMISKH